MHGDPVRDASERSTDAAVAVEALGTRPRRCRADTLQVPAKPNGAGAKGRDLAEDRHRTPPGGWGVNHDERYRRAGSGHYETRRSDHVRLRLGWPTGNQRIPALRELAPTWAVYEKRTELNRRLEVLLGAPAAQLGTR